ncbi:FixH family protein [Pareuzebyella sediminis]|uniref:FixH family protein n=1 Tax=Pareuzebyella sediminis TaxID=2607998 RepID=UPI0011EEA196|nr:FixH family protein [Pareuzebyella sediminis]
MKFNWGIGIVIAFVGFIAFIMFFVVRMATDHRADHDLVTEEYYKAELGYQKEIDAEINAHNLENRLKIEKTSEGLLVTFPDGSEPTSSTGLVSLYRPSNKHLDFDLPISLSNSHLLIPDKQLLDGRWDIKITWEHQGKNFLHKESIMY